LAFDLGDAGDERRRAFSRFWCWLLDSCMRTSTPVGSWTRWTAVATLLTFWPPGPWAVVMCSVTSLFQSIATSTASGSGRTATVAVLGVDAALGFGRGDAFDGVDAGFEGELGEDGFALDVDDGVADAADAAEVGVGLCVEGLELPALAWRSARTSGGGRGPRARPRRRRRRRGPRR
jgi:hypothetical protein